MEDLKHPNIICMFDSFETDDEERSRFVKKSSKICEFNQILMNLKEIDPKK